MKLIVTCSSGTEASVKRELYKLGIEDAKAVDGKIELDGDFELLAKLCVWLRCADRVFIELAKFKATTFDELFDNVKNIPFTEYFKKYTRVMLNGNCYNSSLMAIKTCGSVIKKAVMSVMNDEYGTSSETGSTMTLYFTIFNDICSIMIDACGSGLHKRGYRELTYTAPLKETLACSLIDLSVYSAKKTLVDPFCGSGTIPIEAAMIARNIAPGLNRHFDFEKLKYFPKYILENVKKDAKLQENDNIVNIYASDINPEAIEMAKENARKAGVEQYIHFQVLDMKNFKSDEEYGIIISNPPYGDRLSTKDEVKKIYKNFAQMFKGLKDWSCYILTDVKEFESIMGKKATKKRKLYNARIECTYFSFMGNKPKKV
ncbi:MAG: class I SAM-dependent RNA methyltransferase [Clostridia bacterium]|nr:class I SAM-dependent RNA methyltransferase [Clostridia bacterium]